jgi:phage shock protein A
MTNEEMQSTMQFILEQQAQFSANMQRLEETDERASKRIDRLERVVKLAIRAGFRERKETREKINALIESQLNLTAAQAHTDERLNALIDVVSGGRNGQS